MPPLREYVRCKPAEYLGHLVGHEGRGSLLATLKAAGLATDLSAGVDDSDQATCCSLFTVSIELTPKGVAEVDAVVCATMRPQSVVWRE